MAADGASLTYLNNAATSYPKPAVVQEAVASALRSLPAEPRRGAADEDALSACRRELAALFEVPNAEHIALLPSATHGLNAVIRGIVSPGKHVVSTMLEHNSVLRPLAHLEHERKVRVTRVAPNVDGEVSLQAIEAAWEPETELVAVTQASNVTGAIQNVAAIAEGVAKRGVPLLVDASQGAGAVAISYRGLPGRVFLVAAGHKGLYGPTGTGLLVVPDAHLPQWVVGGTGVRSDAVLHPTELPLRHEAGTPNLIGFAGLSAGVSFVRREGVQSLGEHRNDLVQLARKHLGEIAGVRLLPLARGDGRAGIVSLTLEKLTPNESAYLLREAFGICVRGGLHCAPLAHAAHGTAPEGTIRASFGFANTPDDVLRLVGALSAMVSA